MQRWWDKLANLTIVWLVLMLVLVGCTTEKAPNEVESVLKTYIIDLYKAEVSVSSAHKTIFKGELKQDSRLVGQILDEVWCMTTTPGIFMIQPSGMKPTVKFYRKNWIVFRQGDKWTALDFRAETWEQLQCENFVDESVP